MQDKAIAKLTEGKKEIGDEMMESIADYLIKRCQEDTSFCEDVLHEKKTMTGCMKYLRSQAEKRVKTRSGDQMVGVKDETVYEWAEDYFRQDPAKMKDEPKATAKKKPEKAEKTPETAAKGPKVVENAPEEKKTTEAPKAPDRDHIAKPKKKEKKSNEVEGQMSLFDFMGAM